MGIEEIDVLQSKHLQDLFSDANSESAFMYVYFFLPTNVCKILEWSQFTFFFFLKSLWELS